MSDLYAIYYGGDVYYADPATGVIYTSEGVPVEGYTAAPSGDTYVITGPEGFYLTLQDDWTLTDPYGNTVASVNPYPYSVAGTTGMPWVPYTSPTTLGRMSVLQVYTDAGTYYIAPEEGTVFSGNGTPLPGYVYFNAGNVGYVYGPGGEFYVLDSTTGKVLDSQGNEVGSYAYGLPGQPGIGPASAPAPGGTSGSTKTTTSSSGSGGSSGSSVEDEFLLGLLQEFNNMVASSEDPFEEVRKMLASYSVV